MDMLQSLLNGRVGRLAVLSAMFIALSGLPAYAQSRGYDQHNNQSESCQVSRWHQTNNCQPQQNQGNWQGDQGNSQGSQGTAPVAQPAQSPAHIPDDGNSK
jgi:hypothetical protein